MAEIGIFPAKRLSGALDVPGDKSIAHRALLCGALANGWTRIAGVPHSADVSATMRALGACGIQMQRNDDVVIVQGGGREGWQSDGKRVDCANSGTTLRLLMGILAGLPGTTHLTGDDSLTRRPMRRIAAPLQAMGASIRMRGDNHAPLEVGGSAKLRAIDFALPLPSAQLKSALLLAGLSAEGQTRLHGRVDSRDHTERMLPQFGAEIDVRDGAISVEGGRRLRGIFTEVPGDQSSAAFWIAAALMVPESRIEIRNAGLNPTRLGFVRALQRMGADIVVHARRRYPEPAGSVLLCNSTLHGITLTPDEIPALIDELPLLAVLATRAEGETVVRGAQELRVKESDRIDAIAGVLRAMGAEVDTFDDGFAIRGRQELRGATIDPCGDHRIAMAASIAALGASSATTIRDAECVGVSYPSFFSTLCAIGAEAA